MAVILLPPLDKRCGLNTKNSDFMEESYRMNRGLYNLRWLTKYALGFLCIEEQDICLWTNVEVLLSGEVIKERALASFIKVLIRRNFKILKRNA